MSSLFRAFQSFRRIFVDEGPEESPEKLLERIQQMAVDLTQLVQEVDRVREAQEKASGVITKLVTEINTVTQELTAKTAEAENTVDVNVINDLVTKLKTSTDALNAVIPAPAQ